MPEFDPSKAIRRSSAIQLSRIMRLEPAAPDVWAARDLPAMVRHQFASPLKFDLTSTKLGGRPGQKRKQALTAAAAQGISLFRDLFFHAEPPLELLKLSKAFFKKRTQICRKSTPEWKVAYLFYLLTILVAGERAAMLSALSPADLLKATGWALRQEWVDEKTRELILAARKRLIAQVDSHAS